MKSRVLVPGRPPLLTADGRVVAVHSDQMRLDPRYDRPVLPLEIEIPLRGDREIAVLQALARANLLDFIARSGLSRAGYHGEIANGGESQDIAIETARGGDHVRIPVLWSGLRGGNDEFLMHLTRRFRAGLPIELGRILMAEPETHLNESAVREGVDRHWLKLSEGSTILPDGTLEIPLEEAVFLFNEAGFDENHMNQLIQAGKHGLDDVQALSRYQRFPDAIGAKEFQVGAIQIALGPYLAVIEPDLNDAKVFHLAARVLDGIRTTGFRDPVTQQKIFRQVELFNRSDQSVDTRHLKVRVRLYPHHPGVQALAAQVVNARTLEEGVSFRDIVDIEHHPEKLVDLVHKIGVGPWGNKAHALVLGGGRYYKNPWAVEAHFTLSNLLINAQKLVANEPGAGILRGESIPEGVRGITEVIGHVGGEQNEGKMVVFHALPSAADIDALMKVGVGVFVFKDLRAPEDLYDPNQKNRPQNPRNDLYFDDQLYKQMRGFESRGAKFFMVFNEVPDTHQEGRNLPEHVREFYRGFWVLPQEKERMKKVDTVIAMYGSHVEVTDSALRARLDQDMESFMQAMAEEFGETVAITHGKGPGFMLTADKAAAKHGIYRIGVGIGVEKKGQDANFNPPAMVDFRDNDRLPRQKLMDDLATFKIFNLGGGGTLEEIAITLCSQKLGKNMLTPLIFVDPLGIGKKGGNLWDLLREQIVQLSALPAERLAEMNLQAGDLRQGLDNIQLLAAYTPNYCHLVSSYQEAATIIRDFKRNPAGYYAELIDREKARYGDEGSPGLTKVRRQLVVHLADAWDTHAANHEYSRFPVEEWLNREQIVQLKEAWGVEFDPKKNGVDARMATWFAA